MYMNDKVLKFHTLRQLFHTITFTRFGVKIIFSTFVIVRRILELYYIMNRYLIITTSTDLIRIQSDKIIYISSDGNYTHLIDASGNSRMLSHQLGEIEKLIQRQLKEESTSFLRIGKCLIINRNYINYINIPKQKLILSDAETYNHTLSASKESLKQLKELIEKEGK